MAHTGRGLRDEAVEATPRWGSAVFVRRTEVEAHSLPDQSLLLFDTESATAIPVSESGRKIWEMCDGAHTVDGIVDDLAALYDAERIEIDQDTREFLTALAGHGLVEKLCSR
jgi:hypothetical protein